MRIDFFEEFPTQENLNKLKLINFNSTIYVAAKSFDEFKSIKKIIKKINPKVEAGYWPILEKSYWISPFSYTSELKKLYKDLLNNRQDKKLKILLDLELPFLNKNLFFINLFSFLRNKKLIKKIFKDLEKLNLDIMAAEYPIPSKLVQKKLELLGISYSIKKYPHKKIIMYYSSMIKIKVLQNRIKKYIRIRSKELDKKLQVGLGTIARGVLGKEPILNPKNLDDDLSFIIKERISTVVIYRVGGLNAKYIKIIKKYQPI